jgi:hypothetical protein
VRGEEGSLLSHPHLRSNCHAGEPIKHLFLTYLCLAFANIVSGKIHCAHIVKKVAKYANMLKSSQHVKIKQPAKIFEAMWAKFFFICSKNPLTKSKIVDSWLILLSHFQDLV